MSLGHAAERADGVTSGGDDPMSDRELARLRVMVDLADGRLTVEAAAALMRIGRRQVCRLRSAFAANGPAALASRKRGRRGRSRAGW
jgi:hypothetical protein